MTAEVVAALALAGLWALGGASSISRPRLRLGNYFVLTCWLLAGTSTLCAALAMILDRQWPATWLLFAVSATVLIVRIRTSRHAAANASNDGRAALALVGVGLAAATGITVAALVTRVVLGSPDHVGLVAALALAGVAGLTTLVHVIAPRRGRRIAIWLLGGTGSAIAISGLTLSFVHALIGDLDETTIGLGEAIIGAAASAVVVLAVVPPLLRWVPSLVNDGRPDQATALAQLARIVDLRLPLEETLLQACEVLRSSLQLDHAEAWAVADDHVRLVASDPHSESRTVHLTPNARRVAAGAGDSTDGDWLQMWLPGLMDPASEGVSLAVNYAGEFQGLIIAYGAADAIQASALLDEVAHRIGPVMHSASLDASLTDSVRTLREREASLRASRERLVAAADNERARIERDLHDGVQQHLVALSVNLQLAQGLIRSDPDRAHELMAELNLTARSAAQELRSLSHGIFPKTLENEGIGPALDEVANDKVTVTSSGSRRFPREIETAVYFACSEAITNAIKHADAKTVSVNIVGGSSDLVFEVLDNGTGFAIDEIDATHGLANMADRIGAVDGRLEITSDESGTRVLGTVPLPEA